MKTPIAKKLPSGQFRAQVLIDGQRISITRATKQAAENEAALLKAEYRAGLKVASQGSNTPLRIAIAEYIKSREKTMSPSTIRGYQEIARNRFQSVMDKPMNAIPWQKAIDKELGIVSHKTVKNAFGLIKSVYKENDMEIPKVNLSSSAPADKQYLTPEQIPVFLEAVKGKPCEIPALLALSSLRKSELLALEWDNIDLDRRIIHVRGASVRGPGQSFVKKDENKTKASKRDIPIIQPLFDALEAVQDKTGLVIRCHYQTPYKQVQSLCAREGLPLVGLHGLRHSFASLCYSLGVNEMTCMKLGGWSDYATMRKIYTHIADTELARASNQFTQFFDSLNTDSYEIYTSHFMDSYEV
jgi:integrase